MTATARLYRDPTDPHRTLALVMSAPEARPMTDYAHEPLGDVDPDQLTPADEPAPAWTHKPGIADDRGYAEADGRRWTIALGMAGVRRRNAVYRARLTVDELATQAALSGLVPDPDALPLNTARRSLVIVADEANPDPDSGAIVAERMRAEAADRHRELGAVGMSAWRAMPSAPGSDITRSEQSELTADHHAFEEQYRVAELAVPAGAARQPVYAIGSAIEWRRRYPEAAITATERAILAEYAPELVPAD